MDIQVASDDELRVERRQRLEHRRKLLVERRSDVARRTVDGHDGDRSTRRRDGDTDELERFHTSNDVKLLSDEMITQDQRHSTTANSFLGSRSCSLRPRDVENAVTRWSGT